MRFKRPASSAYWIGWHLVILAAVVTCLSQLRLGALWSLEPQFLPFFIGIACTYLLGAVGITVLTSHGRAIGVVGLAFCVLIPLAAFFLFLLLAGGPFPRSLLLVFAAIMPLLLILSMAGGPSVRATIIGTAGTAAVLATSIGLRSPSPEPIVSPQMTRRIVGTGLYYLDVTYFREYFGIADATGGAIEQVESGYLLALGDGRLYNFTVDAGRTGLAVGELPSVVPMNRANFVRDTEALPEIESRFLRTADILVQDLGGRLKLFAAHHFWNSYEHCITVRVSAIDLHSAEIAEGASRPWTTVFESTPCLPLEDAGRTFFAGLMMGGKLALIDDGTLLLTVGDHSFDGFNTERAFAQDEESSYGKTVLIDLAGGTSRIFTMGHRNPQGLYVSPGGEIWLSEHGPRGGDELNLIVDGRNYGWPLTTYGTDYVVPTWPPNSTPGRHEGYQSPVYSWVPSIGPTSVLGIERDLFPLWRDDLLVGSMVDHAIWRVHLEEGRVTVAERIAVDGRVRDMVEGRDGVLTLLVEGDEAESGLPHPTIALIAPLSEEASSELAGGTRAELLFTQCTGCHPIDESGNHGIGPNLRGIVGRGIAGARGFGYSGPLSQVPGRWTGERLNEYLASPQAFAPGTSMLFDGIANANDRQLLIDYLQGLN